MQYLLFMILLLSFGIYISYIKPKSDIFKSIKHNDDFNNSVLIIQSNSEFDQTHYDSFTKHLKLFFLNYSQAISDKSSSTLPKLQNQYSEILSSLNKMQLNIPDSMRRNTYMAVAVQSLNIILDTYLQEVKAFPL